MIFGVYAIRDVKTGFLAPTVDQTDQSAIRNFEHACQYGESLFFSHPADYSLYKIGNYNTDDGSIEPCQPVIHLVDALSLRKVGE